MAVTTYADLLKQPLGEFTPSPFYEPITDSLLLYERDVRSYAKRISKHFTIFLSIADESFVGFEIKGVQDIIAAIDSEGFKRVSSPVDVNLGGRKGKLHVLVQVAAMEQDVDLDGEQYEAITRTTKNRTIDLDQLQTC